MPPLHIIFLETLKTTAFLVLQLLRNADWLWQKIQADKKKQKFFLFSYKEKMLLACYSHICLNQKLEIG
jgi:hypothetical protein